MCVAPAAVLLTTTAAGAALGAANDYYAVKAGNRTLEYNAAVAEQNAALARQEASYARGQAARNAAGERRQTAALIGAQRARMGASGVTVDAGSFMDVTLSTAEQGERAAMALLQQGDMEGWRHELRAGQQSQQARLHRASKKSPGAALAGGLLSGTARVAGGLASMQVFSGAGTAKSFGGGPHLYK